MTLSTTIHLHLFSAMTRSMTFQVARTDAGIFWVFQNYITDMFAVIGMLRAVQSQVNERVINIRCTKLIKKLTRQALEQSTETSTESDSSAYKLFSQIIFILI